MKYPVTRFESMEIALKEIEPFAKDAAHLQSGKPFDKFGCMRSREIVANWLLCATIQAVDKRELIFYSDPIDGDGIIQDAVTGQTWQTEHVFVPRQSASAGVDTKAPYSERHRAKAVKGRRGLCRWQNASQSVSTPAPANGFRTRLRETCRSRSTSRLSGLWDFNLLNTAFTLMV